jgi:hypothetical protein
VTSLTWLVTLVTLVKVNEDVGHPHACMARATPGEKKSERVESGSGTVDFAAGNAHSESVSTIQVLEEQGHTNVPSNLHTGEASLQAKSGCKVMSRAGTGVCIYTNTNIRMYAHIRFIRYMEIWGVYLAYIGRNLYANTRLRHIRREHAIYACHTRIMRIHRRICTVCGPSPCVAR